MNLYPEMNAQIADVLRISGLPEHQYAAELIDSLLVRVGVLESELAQVQAAAVQWVMYDGTPETLPEVGKLILLSAKGFLDAYLKNTRWLANGGALPSLGGYAVSKLLRDSNGGEGKWIVESTLGWEVLPLLFGDRWAYLPPPPEAES